jgi:hypothetical protein
MAPYITSRTSLVFSPHSPLSPPSPFACKVFAMVINKPHRSPTLPVELSYQILEETWRLPLSTTERRDLLVSLPLVCTSFRWIANRLFLRDAHIVSPAYATHFLSLLQQQQRDRRRRVAGTHTPDDSPALAHSCSCQSITFHIYDPDSSPNLLCIHLPSSSSLVTHALETTLRVLSRDALLAPSLRRVALHYTGWSFTHELDHARLVHLPLHVRVLELHFTTPAAFMERLRHIYVRRYALPMPGVRALSIYGTCPAFVVDVARACPALESLQTDDVYGVLQLQPSLRPFMSPTLGDGAQVKSPVVSSGSKGCSQWGANVDNVVSAKNEMRARAWKRGRGDAK